MKNIKPYILNGSIQPGTCVRGVNISSVRRAMSLLWARTNQIEPTLSSVNKYHLALNFRIRLAFGPNPIFGKQILVLSFFLRISLLFTSYFFLYMYLSFTFADFIVVSKHVV